MRQKSNSTPASSETLVRNIRRATRKHHAAEEKIRIVPHGARSNRETAQASDSRGKPRPPDGQKESPARPWRDSDH